MRKLQLLPLILAINCFPVSPSHAKAPKRHAGSAVALLAEGPMGAATRCVAAVHGAKVTFCGGKGYVEACAGDEGEAGVVFATEFKWGSVGQAYRMEPGQEPVSVGHVAVKSATESVYLRGREVFSCQLTVDKDRAVIRWRKVD